MGNCCNSNTFDLPSDLVYNQNVKIDLLSLTSSEINQIHETEFFLPVPTNNQFNQFYLNSIIVKISSCVLQNIDFTVDQQKPCQDTCAYFSFNNAVFCLLADGHGADGHTISEFALNYCRDYLKKNFALITQNPKSSLSSMLQKCDKKILKNLNCELSGSTFIAIIIHNGFISCASLGDSRAILGQAAASPSLPAVRNNRFFRKIPLNSHFKFEQLTTDQKPELPEETTRIRQAGGLVDQRINESGVRIGPMRVWKQDRKGPGLSMSRSLGDKQGKDCGLISIPIYQEKVLGPKDKYLVIASDGIWDVFENLEAVSFVEKYKGLCLNSSSQSYPATIQNSTIARLLAEEARYRWLGIIQKGRLSIDDISCIVIEFALIPSEKSEFSMGIDDSLTINT